METSSNAAGLRFQKLIEIMARLRAPGGCPWDREQTFETIKKYTLEETYEVLDAIDRKDWRDLREELGDFILQAVFFAEMSKELPEPDRFDINDSLDAINEKLIRRHPHIFGDESIDTGSAVKQRWDEIKAEERKNKPAERKGLLSPVPRALPALVEAQQITSRAAGVGFDWSNTEQIVEKLHEELAEFDRARASGNASDMEDELGDLLFVIVNIARFAKVDPEQALRRTNTKFRDRFGHIENRLAEQGRELKGTSIEEMEALWQEAKQASRK
jgi:tetrapyrrole methylase family protein/MazG family protein